MFNYDERLLIRLIFLFKDNVSVQMEKLVFAPALPLDLLCVCVLSWLENFTKFLLEVHGTREWL